MMGQEGTKGFHLYHMLKGVHKLIWLWVVRLYLLFSYIYCYPLLPLISLSLQCRVLKMVLLWENALCWRPLMALLICYDRDGWSCFDLQCSDIVNGCQMYFGTQYIMASYWLRAVCDGCCSFCKLSCFSEDKENCESCQFCTKKDFPSRLQIICLSSACLSRRGLNYFKAFFLETSNMTHADLRDYVIKSVPH